MKPLDLVLSKCTNPIRDGGGFKACCPAHDDVNPSLAVNEGDDGKVLLKCWSGCSTEEIVGAMGLRMRDLFPEDRCHQTNCSPRSSAKQSAKTERIFPTAEAAIADYERNMGPRTAEWTYHDREGKKVGVVARWDSAGGTKEIRPVSLNRTGWKKGGMAEPRPLYRLPELIAATSRIYIVEGEKCVEAVRSIGLTATTSPHGAQSADKADWSVLAGEREVVIVPDNDKAGEKYAADVMAQLSKLSPRPTIKILRLDGLPDGGDIFDWIENRDAIEPDAIRQTIETLADSAKIIEPADDWPDPQPLPDDLPDVMPFDFDLLPTTLRPWIEDISERLQCPPDFPAVAAMVALAGVVGRKLGIRPKRHDDWLVVPNLWGMVVGRPSLMKTPAIQEPLKMVKRLELAALEIFQREQQEFIGKKAINEAKNKIAKKAIQDALQNGDDPNNFVDDLRHGDDDEPIRRRYLTNDCTVEALGELLNQNPNGLIVYRDELVGWLRSLEKDGQECSRSFFLESWNGNGRYTFDRIGRGTLDIAAATTSIIGAIQPGPLQQYLHDAIKGGGGDDGLLQRFQLAVWPDASTDWRNVDRWPDSTAREAAWEVFQRLNQLNADDFGAEHDQFDSSEIPFLRFSPTPAQPLFDDWRAALEKRLRSGNEHPAIEAHLSKFKKLVPALALLIHLVDTRGGLIGDESLDKAIRWATYLESHARRIYGAAVKPDLVAAKALAGKIKAGELGEQFALRDVYRQGWSGLSTTEDAQQAADVLSDFDWLRTVEQPTAGRSRTIHVINPKIHELAS
jgi:putative DNA primase/helicase